MKEVATGALSAASELMERFGITMVDASRIVAAALRLRFFEEKASASPSLGELCVFVGDPDPPKTVANYLSSLKRSLARSHGQAYADDLWSRLTSIPAIITTQGKP